MNPYNNQFERQVMVPMRGQTPMAAGYDMAPAPAPVDSDTASQFVTFGEITGALLRRKWMLLTLVVVCAGTGLAIAYSQPPVYQAKALIEIQGINENFLNRRELDPTAAENPLTLEPYIQTQVKLLQTSRLLGRVADKLQLTDQPEFQAKEGLVARIKSRFSKAAPASIDDKRQDLLAEMNRNLAVRLAGDTHIVEVAYESTSPQVAASVANTISEEYLNQNLEKRLSATEYTGKWLSGQLQELKKSLDEAEHDLEAYVTAHGLLASSESSKVSIEDNRLKQLETAYQTARESRINDQSRYQMVSTAPIERLSDAIDNETVRLYQTKLTELKQKLAEVRAVYTASHYKVREIQAQIDEVQSALERERAALVNRLRNQYEASSKRESLLETDLNHATGQATKETAEAIRFNRLKRTVDTYSKLYEGTLEKVKETDLASAVRANNAQIVETAVAPSTPVRPSKGLYGAIGMICGMLLGSVVALRSDRRNRFVGMPGSVGARLGIREFGAIPCASLELPYTVRSSALLPRTSATTMDDDGVLRNWLEVVTWRQRGSQMAESYRSTLASLMNSMEAMSTRVIVFSSAGPNEGKTTVITNIGIALAETGRKVLLIDADRRRPRLHEVFNRSNRYGLSEYLTDSTRGPRDLMEMTQPTGIPGLRVLTAGLDRSCSPNLVHNLRMSELLAAARLEFDTILVDTPPLLALSDARGLGQMADGMALVVRAQHTPEQVLVTVLDRLRQDGIRVLGTILNSWKPDRKYAKTYYENAGYAAAAYRQS